ncbi:DUF6441 family protein [Leisingera sp.]|uniref:DUF6441 family protein n=1 Tax=Leisingera sp. TaxID=1879318 RepID=UPI002B2647CE|nr:DUF6441 family protein [Leisingera sp.]
MALRFNIKHDGRDPLAMMLDEIIEAEKAVSYGTKEAGRGLLKDWRGQVRSSLSYRMAGALRARNYPDRQNSINAASLVYAPSNKGSKRLAPLYGKDPGASASEVLEAHDKGATIRSPNGFFLAIPLGKAARMRGADTTGRGDRSRITPGGWERRTGRQLRLVYRKGQNSLLVDDGAVAPGNQMKWRGGRGGGRYTSPRAIKRREPIPIFVLVPQVKLRKKLDLDRDAIKWGGQLPALILKNWKG